MRLLLRWEGSPLNDHLRMQLREEPWPAGTHTYRPCPICGNPWRPFAFSYLPCHAKCVFTDEAVDLLRAHYDDPTTRMGDFADDFGVTPGVIRATLHSRCGIPQK